MLSLKRKQVAATAVSSMHPLSPFLSHSEENHADWWASVIC